MKEKGQQVGKQDLLPVGENKCQTGCKKCCLLFFNFVLGAHEQHSRPLDYLLGGWDRICVALFTQGGGYSSPNGKGGGKSSVPFGQTPEESIPTFFIGTVEMSKALLLNVHGQQEWHYFYQPSPYVCSTSWLRNRAALFMHLLPWRYESIRASQDHSYLASSHSRLHDLSSSAGFKMISTGSISGTIL